MRHWAPLVSAIILAAKGSRNRNGWAFYPNLPWIATTRCESYMFHACNWWWLRIRVMLSDRATATMTEQKIEPEVVSMMNSVKLHVWECDVPDLDISCPFFTWEPIMKRKIIKATWLGIVIFALHYDAVCSTTYLGVLNRAFKYLNRDLKRSLCVSAYSCTSLNEFSVLFGKYSKVS